MKLSLSGGVFGVLSWLWEGRRKGKVAVGTSTAGCNRRHQQSKFQRTYSKTRAEFLYRFLKTGFSNLTQLSFRIFILPFKMILLILKINTFCGRPPSHIFDNRTSLSKLLAQVHRDSLSLILMQSCNQTFSMSSLNALLLF